ncbi:MAG: glycosyltransferase family 39 protein [Verrucomicrobiales bacterium]|nr:glycosyltransferase family 39 protein [Verrucomicrobiales bacterium]
MTHTRLFARMLALHGGPLLPRSWSLVHYGVLLASVGWSAWSLFHSRRAAIAAVATVALSPACLDLSLSAMQEMPMTAWGMLAVAFALASRHAPHPGYLLASGACAVVSLLLKLTGGVFVAACVLILLAGEGTVSRPTQGHRLRRALGYSAAVATLCGLGLAIVDGRPLSTLLGSHWTSRVRAAGSGGQTLVQTGLGLWAHAWPVLIAAVLAAWPGARRPPGCGSSLALQAAVLLPVVLFHLLIRPWWGYYSVSAIAVLAPAAGYAVVRGREDLRLAWQTGVPSRTFLTATLRMIVLALAAGAAGLGWVERIRLWNSAPRVEASPILRAIEAYQADGPAGCMYSADAMDAFWAGIPVPPELLVISEKRFLSGSLPEDGVPRVLERSGCDFIVLPEGSAPTRGETWNALLSRDYVRTTVGAGKELFVHRELDPRPHESHVRW